MFIKNLLEQDWREIVKNIGLGYYVDSDHVVEEKRIKSKSSKKSQKITHEFIKLVVKSKDMRTTTIYHITDAGVVNLQIGNTSPLLMQDSEYNAVAVSSKAAGISLKLVREFMDRLGDEYTMAQTKEREILLDYCYGRYENIPVVPETKTARTKIKKYIDHCHAMLAVLESQDENSAQSPAEM